MTGATEERFEIVKWCYIEADDDTGYDAAAEVIERSMTYLDERTPHRELHTEEQEVEQERRDLLDDLDTVLRGQRVPAADVPALLWDLAPDYKPYRGLTGVKLRAQLERNYQIKVPSTGNRYPIDPGAIRAHVAERDAARPSSGDEDEE